jgi:hypothetical protein
MRLQAAVMRHLHTAQNEPPPRAEGMDIESLADSHRRHTAAGKTSGG